MAQEQEIEIQNKLYTYSQNPKGVLLAEIEQIIDDDQRYFFEELREKVLSDSTLTVNDILYEAESLISPDKQNDFEILKFVCDDQKPMN